MFVMFDHCDKSEGGRREDTKTGRGCVDRNVLNSLSSQGGQINFRVDVIISVTVILKYLRICIMHISTFLTNNISTCSIVIVFETSFILYAKE